MARMSNGRVPPKAAVAGKGRAARTPSDVHMGAVGGGVGYCPQCVENQMTGSAGSTKTKPGD